MNTGKLVNGNKILTFAQLQWSLTMISKHIFINCSFYVTELSDNTKYALVSLPECIVITYFVLKNELVSSYIHYD